MRYHYYLQTAEKLISEYQPGTPISHSLKDYYRANRRMGSTDRKTVSSLVYSYFRTGNLLKHLPATETSHASGRLPAGQPQPAGEHALVNERLLAAWFLCHDKSTPLLKTLRPDWDQKADLPVTKKLEMLAEWHGVPLDPLNIFPCHEQLSEGIEQGSYALSMLRQPDLFLRLRSGSAQGICEKLRDAQVPYEELSPTCLSLKNATRLEEILTGFKGEFQIQDRSSQQTGNFFRPKPGERWWDACAGSGGKSLLLHDLEPAVKLYVTDHRPAILLNLHKRFNAAGIKEYEAHDADLIKKESAWNEEFDGIIMDVPCSGSGTWGRTPEMMKSFSRKRISGYRELQEQLVKKVLPFLKSGSPLIYITCSVFREENEELVSALCKEGGLELEAQALLEGYLEGADTMFVARLLKQ